jgi:alkyldihydroxyacetonephosphate synthase
MRERCHVRKRSWWGWGWEDEAITGESLDHLAAAIRSRPGFGHAELRRPPAIAELDLRAPRVAPPTSLEPLCATDDETRAAHTYGKSFRDVVRAFARELPNPPDVVALPENEDDVVALLDWCTDARLAAIPYGRGSSVVGGVECHVGDDYAGVVSIDLTRLDRVVEVDTTSRAARIQAGALGPVLEEQLRPHGYTLRHFPQSFEHSTLGGWLATRSGGHYATNYTHIDDFVESMRIVTPRGIVESRRLPGSGAGPSPDRLFLGSEGILGIITEAWMRVQDRPTFRATASVRFPSFAAGVAAARAVSQAGLFPSNCRLLDPGEASSNAGTAPGDALLVLGFESADHPLDAWIARAVECCADHGGVHDGVSTSSVPRPERSPERDDSAAERWRSSFLRAPYGRDAVVAVGCIAETFETACTWDAFESLHADVVSSASRALPEGGAITCRFTHVYPDGAAPYFTVLAPATHGTQLERWAEVKEAASAAIIRGGGTITHHHAVGRDHKPWYAQQRPDLFAEALRATKRTLDPGAILNPGVLVDL